MKVAVWERAVRWSTVWAVTSGAVGFVLGIAAAVSGVAWLATFAGLGALVAAGFALVAASARGNAARRGDAGAASQERASESVADDVAAPHGPATAGDAGRRRHDRPYDTPPTRADPGSGSNSEMPEPGWARPEPVTSSSTNSNETMTDPESGLYSEAYFEVALGWRVASARRHLRPVSVAFVDVVEGLAIDRGHPPEPHRIADAIDRTLRDADLACRLGDGSYAFIFEDSPEAGAVWTVERLRRTIVSQYGSHTMWAGIASYPTHGLDTAELVAQAHAALVAAHDWTQDRIEVASPPSA